MRGLRYGVRRTGARPISAVSLNRDSWQFNGLVLAVPILPYLDIPSLSAGATGDPLIDISGNGVNPTLAVGSVPIVLETDPEFGYVFRGAIPGASAEYTFPALTSFFNTEATICGWVKLNNASPGTAGATGFPFVVGSSNSGASHYPYTDGTVYAQHFLATRTAFTPLAGVDRAAWHHLLITSKPGANGWACYQNGQLAFSQTGDSTVSVSGNLSYGCGNQGGGFTFDGWQCDLRLYNRWMSPEEALALASPQTRWDLFVPQAHRALDLFAQMVAVLAITDRPRGSQRPWPFSPGSARLR